MSTFFVSLFFIGGIILERDLDSFSRDVLKGQSLDFQLAGNFSTKLYICTYCFKVYMFQTPSGYITGHRLRNGPSRFIMDHPVALP